MYYLNNRFYDQEIGRFINADTVDLVLESQTTLTDKNLYAYCDNNPVMRRDQSGAAWETVFDVISLGASIADVAANPTSVWAWAGLAGDIADVAIPFIGGIGETIKCCGAVNKADNIIDVVKKGGSNSKATFASEEKLLSHFDKHGGEFKGIFNSADEYLQGAQDVMQNGYKVEYAYKGEIRTGYVQFMGNNSKGNAKFAFVGTNNEGYITTFHTESGKSFWKMLNGENIPVINPK